MKEELDPNKKTILVVDDEKPIIDILVYNLKKEGYNTLEATDGEMGINVALEARPDLILLDVMLPKVDGLTVCNRVKQVYNVPILMISARDEEVDKIVGLELGADDYVIKPFSPKELEARVKAVLRRTISKDVIIPSSSSSASGSAAGAKGGKNIITTGAIKIDTARRQVYRKNERIRLTGMEFSLLELLVNNSGQAYSRNEILQHVWSYPADHRIDTRVVDVHISRLRSKLEADPTNPELILTARGIGYMFQRIN